MKVPLIVLIFTLATTGLPLRTVTKGLALPNQLQAGPIPANCESNSSTLSSTSQAARATGQNSLIIVIARLGNGEHRKALNLRRLHNVRVFLTEFEKHPSETVITAEGEPTKGFGRVELYVGGRLFEVIAIKKNGDLLVSFTCEPDEIRPKWADRNFYPYFDKGKKKH